MNLEKIPKEYSIKIWGENRANLNRKLDCITSEFFEQNFDLLVDALLGIGQKSAPRGNVESLLRASATRKANYNLSIDTVTGINSDTGEVFDTYFPADHLLTVANYKRGYFQYPALALDLDCRLIDLNLKSKAEAEFYLSNSPDENILKRKIDGNKGSFGRVLVIGGSESFPGAPILASNSAIDSGSGLVELAYLQKLPLPGLNPRVVLANLPDEKFLTLESFAVIAERAKLSDALCIGMGMGQSPKSAELLEKLIQLDKPKVVDADALNILAQKSNYKLDFQTVITPHPGEAARLLNTDTKTIQSDRFTAIKELNKKYKAVVVLKGAGSLVYGNKGWVNLTGDDKLAQAGSGDILAGMIASLLARGINAEDAARIAVFRHGELAQKLKFYF